MSVELLSRERGAVIRCGSDAIAGRPPCSETIATGQTAKGLIRGYARSKGWGKSATPGFLRIDLCPSCLGEDQERNKEHRRVRCGHSNCVAVFLASSPKAKRKQAERAGWGRMSKRGRGKGAKVLPLCPAHVAEEHRRVAALDVTKAA